MIHFCTCTGRSASSLEETGKLEVAPSCKICGQKPLVYERGALSGSMQSTVEVGLTTRVIDPDLSWTVPKSNKRAARRARASLTASGRTKPVSGSLKDGGDLIDKDQVRVEDMPVSESEKLGVSILGQRFSDSIKNVPIKKRKFPLVRSPSPPPRTPPRPEESERLLKSPPTSNRKKPAMRSYEHEGPTYMTAVSTILDQGENVKLDVDHKHNLTKIHDKHGDNADFSGISILAAAACSGNIDCGSSNLEDPASYISLAAGGVSTVTVQNTQPSSVPEEFSEKHLPNYSILDNKTDQNICIATQLEKNISAANDNAHRDDLKSSKCPTAPISEKSMDIIQDVLVKENETQQRVETSSLRDDRLHWDLNIVMDAWESPCDEPVVDPKPNDAFGIDKDPSQKEKVKNFGQDQVQMEFGDGKDHIEMSTQHNVGGAVVTDGMDSCRVVISSMQDVPPFSTDHSVAEIAENKNETTDLLLHESNEEEHHLDACTGSDVTSSLEKIPCETDEAPNIKADASEETQPLHNQELIGVNADSTAASRAECETGPASHDSSAIAEEKVVQCISSSDGERNSEIISSDPVVLEDTSGDHTTHLHQPHGSVLTNNAGICDDSVDASVVDPLKQSRDQVTSDAQGSKASCSRSPSPGGDCKHMEGDTLYEDGNSFCSLLNQSGDQCVAERSEGGCLMSPQLDKHVACLGMNLDEVESHIDDSLMIGHCSERGSGLLVGNISKMIAEDGNCIEQSESGERSSSHLDSSGQDSLNSEELPTAVTFSQGDKAASDMKEQDGKTTGNFYVHVSVAEMNTHMHVEPKDSPQNAIDETLGKVDTPAAMGNPVSLKACESNDDDHAYGSGEVALEDPFKSDYDSDNLSQNDNATSMEKLNLFQADDDSQYEDGEFRESVMHCWEDEGEDREAERVDYGSDNIDTDAFEPSQDDALVDSVECKKETVSEASHVCQEGTLDGEKNKKEPNCQPSLKGSLENDPSPAKSGERRAMKVVRKVSRRDFGKKDEDEKVKMGVKVVSEVNASDDKVLRDGEFSSRESRRSAILRTKSTGWDQLPDAGRSSRDAVVDVRGSSILKNRVSHLESSDADGSLRRVVRSSSTRELSSRVEGPNCSDASHRKDKVYIDGSRSNNLDDINRRIERDVLAKSIGRGGSSVHMHGRGRVGNHWLESSGGHWGRNRRHSPSYHGPGDHGLHGPKNAAAAAAAKLESSGFFIASDGTIVRAGGVTPDRVRRQSANSPSQNVRRSLTRRGSPTDRDGELGFVMPLGHGHMREMSPSRSIGGARGRSGRYAPRVCGTDRRERFSGPLYDGDIGSSLPVPHTIARRQRSFSPIPRRPFHRSRSRSKSPSRSRSRSPHMWTSPRGSSGINRDPGLRRQLSRSPNFHSEARMERPRSPHRRPGFPVNTVDFVPAARNHSSPPHASRWFDDRRGDAPDHFSERDYKRASISERSSPGRGFSRSHRFDLMDSPGRIKTDEYFRPMHSGRFPEFVGVVGRRSRHEGSDDDRQKHGERYRMVHSMRHYDDDGMGKRFRYDVDNGFGEDQPRSKSASESRGRGSPRNYSRGIESRLGGAPKRDGEERGHFRYDRGEKMNSNFKTFGMRECDESASARRRPT